MWRGGTVAVGSAAAVIRASELGSSVCCSSETESASPVS